MIDVATERERQAEEIAMRRKALTLLAMGEIYAANLVGAFDPGKGMLAWYDGDGDGKVGYNKQGVWMEFNGRILSLWKNGKFVTSMPAVSGKPSSMNFSLNRDYSEEQQKKKSEGPIQKENII